MGIETVEGWLLHKIPSGDTSLTLTFFSREKGLIRASHKGGRNPKKQGGLQAFTPLWLQLNERRNWHYIQKIELLSPTTFLAGKALFAALYVNELLYYTLTPLETQQSLFEIYVLTIQNLANATSQFAIELSLRYFEKELLFALGEGVSFQEEASLAIPIDSNHFYEFIAGVGFQKTAEKGILGADILKINEGKLDDPTILKLAKVIMRQAIDALLNGRELKSRAFARAHSLLK